MSGETPRRKRAPIRRRDPQCPQPTSEEFSLLRAWSSTASPSLVVTIRESQDDATWIPALRSAPRRRPPPGRPRSTSNP